MGILEVLVKNGVVAKTDVPEIRKELSVPGARMEAILVKRGVNSDDILRAKGESVGIPTLQLGNRKIPFEVMKQIPEESAVYYHFVPLGLKENVLEVGIIDPDNLDAFDALNFIVSKNKLDYQVYLISEADYQRVMQLYKSLSGEVGKALSELEQELSVGQKKDDKEDFLEGKQEGETRIIEDAPVTKIVATILHYATEGQASDIHVEPMADRVRVRFRVDGVLTTSLILPKKVHQAVVARIKILSNMRLDERRKPQDGRFSATMDKRKVDFRVSTFPTYYGEKLVMRILDSEKGVKKLDELELSSRNLQLLRDAIQRPYGMVLISGPTGSGKSTTLYSMLEEVDRDRKNVLSLEDPVEYSIAGISQSQVRPEIGYTFANGLRTTLRQDPDVIMVGEIRDKETAQLAVQAALTGHLVLSTIHTNNALGAIPRLIDMGVDPYLIPPTLILAAAQRLAVKLCDKGGDPMPIEGSIKVMYDEQFMNVPEEFRKEYSQFKNVFKPKPTPECPKGVSGRVAVFEVLSMTPEIETAVLRGASEVELMKLARKQGMLTMKEDAMIKAAKGLIPFEEISSL